MKKQIIDILKENPDVCFSQMALQFWLSVDGIENNSRRIREAIHEIKLSGDLPNLISTAKGYKLAQSPDEVLGAVKRLENQIASMKASRERMLADLEAKTGFLVVKDTENSEYRLCHIDELEYPEYSEGAEVFKNWQEVLEWENRGK